MFCHTGQRIARRLLLVGAALALGCGIGSAPADARALELGHPPLRGVTAVVEGTTGAVAGAVEGVGGPAASQTVEAVTKPVEEVAAPVHQAVEGAPSTVTGAAPPAPQSPTPPPTVAPPQPSGGSGAGAGPSHDGGKVAGGATATVTGTGREVTGAATPPRSSGGGTTGPNAAPSASGDEPSAVEAAPQPTGVAVPETAATGPRPSADAAPKATGRRTVRRSGGDARPAIGGDRFGPAPSDDGSVGAPLPKWIAYVWPAIALARPDLAGLLVRSVQDGAPPAIVTALSGTADADGGPTGSFGVAGVHAAGGHRDASNSSQSLPERIPAAIGDAAAKVHGQVLAYLLLAAILLAAFFFVVKGEFARRDRG